MLTSLFFSLCFSLAASVTPSPPSHKLSSPLHPFFCFQTFSHLLPLFTFFTLPIANMPKAALSGTRRWSSRRLYVLKSLWSQFALHLFCYLQNGCNAKSLLLSPCTPYVYHTLLISFLFHLCSVRSLLWHDSRLRWELGIEGIELWWVRIWEQWWVDIREYHRLSSLFHLPDYHEKPLICIRGLTCPTCQSVSSDRQIIQFFILFNNSQVCLLVSVSLSSLFIKQVISILSLAGVATSHGLGVALLLSNIVKIFSCLTKFKIMIFIWNNICFLQAFIEESSI